MQVQLPKHRRRDAHRIDVHKYDGDIEKEEVKTDG